MGVQAPEVNLDADYGVLDLPPAAHTELDRHALGTLVLGMDDRDDLGQREPAEGVIARRDRRLGRQATPPSGAPQAPPQLRCGARSRKKRRHVGEASETEKASVELWFA